MQEATQAKKHLEEAGIPFIENEPLSHHTSFKIGGPAAYFCTPGSAEALAETIAIAKQLGLPWFVLGKGSNVLFRDEGYAGMIIRPEGDAFTEVAVGEDGRARAGCAVPLGVLCKTALKNGRGGLAFAYGIPGSVGGAVYMNAGAYGGEMADVLESVRYLDEQGKIVTAPAAELALGYRSSIFQQKPFVILDAVFALPKADPAETEAQMRENMKKREEKQPLDMPSAGSAFKRPPGAFAGALIDQCGLRGFRVGGAAISEKHCGFIVNMGGASCQDVLQVADMVSQKVEEQTGYRLEKEIRVIEEV